MQRLRIYLLPLALASACSGDDGSTGDDTSGESGDTDGDVEPCFEVTLEGPCDLDSGYTLDSTNPFYPLIVGHTWVLEGDDEGEFIRIEREVLEDTQTIEGIETHVLEHREFIDGELYEVARNFYVEANDGTVCYFGEDVDFYENGEIANHEGTWRVGVDGALPGIIMPAAPAVGDAYYQERGPEAQDQGRVDSVDTTEMIGDTSYDGVLTVIDANPLDACDALEPKLYVPNVGEAADVGVVLIEFQPGA